MFKLEDSLHAFLLYSYIFRDDKYLFKLEDSLHAFLLYSYIFRDDKYLFKLEDSLRAFLLKLNVCDAQLKPLPEGKIFKILTIHLLNVINIAVW